MESEPSGAESASTANGVGDALSTGRPPAVPPRNAVRSVLIVGATSGIAAATAAEFAAAGWHLILAARDLDAVGRLAADLRIRHETAVDVEPFDALADDPDAFAARCLAHTAGGLDGVLVCFGVLIDQQLAQRERSAARRACDLNFTLPVLVLEAFADSFENRGSGFLAAISSVAGDRGRQSNYLYGAAKAGLSAYLQGLRNRLHARGVSVLTIKPGFVATPMTEGLLDPDSPLVASPDRVARDIFRAIRRRQNVLYTPWWWQAIMLVIRSIPEPLFKRLKL